MKIRPSSVGCVLPVGEEGLVLIFSINPEERQFFQIPELVTLPDHPQCSGRFGNIHHGSLVRKLLMDTIHPHRVPEAAVGSVAYVQMSDISPANVTDVLKP